MRYKVILFFISVFLSAGILAQTLYVSSAKTTLYSEANSEAKKVSELKRGDQLNVVKEQGSWILVRNDNKQGWVKKLFVSTQKPGDKVSILSESKTNKNVHIRKRASSDVTAASARGLSQDNEGVSTRFRGNRSMLEISEGYAILETMEVLTIDEEELLDFLKAERIQN
ncbi:MAG: SH3 domain-containing protein [Leptospirales bacterium]